MAQWIRHLTTNQGIPGSSPGMVERFSVKLDIAIKILAPGEARTPDLRISLSVLTYKYDALTDCATGAIGLSIFMNL